MVQLQFYFGSSLSATKLDSVRNVNHIHLHVICFLGDEHIHDNTKELQFSLIFQELKQCLVNTRVMLVVGFEICIFYRFISTK